MNLIPDKILVVAGAESKAIIAGSLENLAGLEILEADSENKAFELIYNHFFVLVIIDETLAHIDMYKIGSMLLSHKETHNAPLLILTDRIQPEKFLIDFKALHIDYLLKPFDEQLIRAKIDIFFDLFKQRNAVEQSLGELDKAYKKIIVQHELVMEETVSRKELVNRSTIAASQMQQPLRSLQGNIYQLLRTRGVAPEIRSSLNSLKTAVEGISQISKKLLASPGKAKKIVAENAAGMATGHIYKILYIEDSDEDFSIFNHFMKSIIKCELAQAKTLEHGLELLAANGFDLVFIDYLLPDGTGFDLLSRLNRMLSDIPVIFTLDKPHIHVGPRAVSRGALSYFIKEEVTAENILSIIHNTLAKAKISQEVSDAQNRIITIARKDSLTKLYNRQCFDQELESEASKSKRYHTPLSILILDFDKFKSIGETHGPDIRDRLLTTSATLIQSMVRDNDVVCRYGAEEFGIVLSNTALNDARMLAERIRKRIAGHAFEKETVTLTVSIGIAAYVPESDMSCSALVKNALKALTSAMDKGGNTVKTFIR